MIALFMLSIAYELLATLRINDEERMRAKQAVRPGINDPYVSCRVVSCRVVLVFESSCARELAQNAQTCRNTERARSPAPFAVVRAAARVRVPTDARHHDLQRRHLDRRLLGYSSRHNLLARSCHLLTDTRAGAFLGHFLFHRYRKNSSLQGAGCH